MTWRFGTVVAAVGLMLAASCSKPSYEPRPIKPDIDVCIICNMSVANEDYATEVVLTDGKIMTFDDIGCMMDYIQSYHNADNPIAKSYVYAASNWVELEQAWFAYHQDFWTPMANGVLAFPNKEHAEQYVAQEGKGNVLSFPDLKQHKWDGHQ